ncbi:hypothetical protein QEV83_07780 [Methylocapsa sp. D3K7]|uniref:hypothetical protein n=1 Tax=Methylocapsa sp. D3K7 TaxID=3041435 RepID=UPI00244EF591|nr:hypothetical protein [Methylocapsa sp. D3K7]WGJ16131.1 hypothetical protein QEV83_07780 [Methylocapsa sp. D3K7]
MKKLSKLPSIENRTVVLSIKVRPSLAKALVKAAKDSGRTKARFTEEVLELYLRELGVLK